VKLKQNAGNIDRIIKTIIAVALLGGVVLNYIPFPWAYLAILIALVGLFTAATGTCLVYSLFGWSTK